MKKAGNAAALDEALRSATLPSTIWVATDEPLLGTADIQSLADLGNAYANLKQMRLVVFDRSALIALAVALLLPVTPLVLTMFSVDELMNKLVSILL